MTTEHNNDKSLIVKWGEKIENIGKLMAPLYLLITGFFQDWITEEEYLLLVPLAFLIGLGLFYICPKISSVKSLIAKDYRWGILLIVYVGTASYTSYAWFERHNDQPPVINELLAQTTYLRSEDETELRVWARDPEEGTLAYQWAITKGGGTVRPETGPDPKATYDGGSTPAGEVEITVIVVDDKGQKKSKPVYIHILSGLKPRE